MNSRFPAAASDRLPLVRMRQDESTACFEAKDSSNGHGLVEPAAWIGSAPRGSAFCPGPHGAKSALGRGTAARPEWAGRPKENALPPGGDAPSCVCAAGDPFSKGSVS